jgi:intracellular multiplication protein IcmE
MIMGEKMNNVKQMLNNPKQRNIYLGTIGISAILVVFGLFYATKGKKEQDVPTGANVPNVPQINAVPGTSNSPEYNKMVSQYNQQEGLNALKSGKSYIPTPVNNQTFDTTSPIDDLDKVNAEKQKQIKQQMVIPQMKPTQTEPIVTVKKPVPKAPEWSENDYMLIATLNGAWKAQTPASEFNYSGQKEQQNQNSNMQNNASENMNQTANQQVAIPIEKAGNILDAELVTSINSDEPSPVLAKVVAGKLKGATLIGSFTRVGEKNLVQFNTISIPGLPNSQPISAVAIDPNTSRTALATDVNNHYLLKYGVLLASSFLSGYAQALQMANTTTTVGPLGGVTTTSNGNISSKQINEMALGQVGTTIANNAQASINNLPPTVKVAGGTAIGLLIMKDLTIK